MNDRRLSFTRKWVLLLHIFWLAGIFVPAGFAQEGDTEGMVITIGSSPLNPEDAAAARQAAIDDALSAAVRTTVLELVDPTVLADKFRDISPELTGDLSRFTMGYKVLEEHAAGKNYLVLLQTRISRQAVEVLLDASGLAANSVPLPKILLCVAETGADDPEPIYWWGDATGDRAAVAAPVLRSTLIQHGFQIVDPAEELPGILKAAISDRPYLSANEAANVGRHFQADVVVFGTARTERGRNTMGSSNYTFQATLDLQAVRSNTGAELANTTKTETATGANESAGTSAAMEQGAVAAGDTLATQLTAAWREAAKSVHTIEIEVAGTSDLESFIALRRELSQINGVREMFIDELKADVATLSVAFEGKAQDLAEELMSKSHETFSIHIETVEGDRIGLALIPVD